MVLYLIKNSQGNLGLILPIISVYALAGMKLLPAMLQIYSSVATVKGNLAAYESIREDLANINAQICDGLSENKHQIYKDRAIALTEAILELKAEDILVVLGKGREDYQEVMGEKLPYSDLEIIERFINAD
jgi:hypothetical protein